MTCFAFRDTGAGSLVWGVWSMPAWSEIQNTLELHRSSARPLQEVDSRRLASTGYRFSREAQNTQHELLTPERRGAHSTASYKGFAGVLAQMRTSQEWEEIASDAAHTRPS